MEKVVLSKPFVFEDKEYREIEMDLEGLTGRDLINAANVAKTLGDPSPVAELSKAYLAAVAARAAKVPVELITSLPAKDFTAVTLAVQNFLFE
ncbi:MAG: phage tail assembly protein [Firmicutes bacterium]|nr:phage tail assembly protein [Bacillota bacterium]